ncbi:hypothetical protein PF002_g30840, partial [Phytophthora fragariae]
LDDPVLEKGAAPVAVSNEQEEPGEWAFCLMRLFQRFAARHDFTVQKPQYAQKRSGHA